MLGIYNAFIIVKSERRNNRYLLNIKLKLCLKNYIKKIRSKKGNNMFISTWKKLTAYN